MKITKSRLMRIIREERQHILRELHDPLDPHAGGRGLNTSIQDIFDDAGLTPQEASATLAAVEEGGFDWMETSSYEKLLWYFMDTGEMPYGVAKARTGDPDIWILDHLEGLGA